MLNPQDAISIPIAYIETFAMTFGAFLIGYAGSRIYANSGFKKIKERHIQNTKHLHNKIKNLQEELDQKADGVYRKDRMDQEFVNVQVRSRAFSEEVISESVIDRSTLTGKESIDFSRIGIASSAHRNDLQLITGIGPYTEAKLNELGIYTFDQISKFTKNDIEVVTKLIKFFPDRIKEDRWVQKAKRLKGLEDNQGPESESIKKMINKKTT